MAAFNIPAAAPAAKPNIIIVLADDLGGRELGCYGNTFNETPQLDKMAKEGMRFTSAYSPAPVCSPSRASLMTGQLPARNGITDFLEDNDDFFLDPARFTALPKMLKAAGYHTGMIGKWHLSGDYRENPAPPTAHGFDEAILTETSYIGGGDYRFPYDHIAGAVQRIFPDEDLTKRLNLEALDFISRNKSGPFFLYLSHYAVHTKLDAPDSLAAHFNAKRGTPGNNASNTRNPVLAAMLKLIDDGVGDIESKFKELGLDSNTLVLFTSDNGGAGDVTDNGELREGKAWLYEGGIRIPFVARWPGVVPSGTERGRPISHTDLYPTFASLAGGALPAGQTLDGTDIGPILRGTGDIAPRSLVWHYPQVVTNGHGGRSWSAIQDAKGHKLMRSYDDDHIELYRLADDVSEAHDLATDSAATARSLASELSATIARCLQGSVFRDDFNDKDASEWTRFGGAWSAASGAYAVNGGDGFKAFTNNRYFANVLYEAKVTVGAAGNGGLVLRASNGDSGRFAYRGYYASISAADGKVAFSKTGNGTAKSLGEATLAIQAGTAYPIRVVARGSVFRIFVSDTLKPLLTVSDSSFDGGLIGLRSYNSAADFDDIYARGLAPDSATISLTDRREEVGRNLASRRMRQGGTWLFSNASNSTYDLRGEIKGIPL